MAKKSGFSKYLTDEEIKICEDIWLTGVLQSLCFNVILLLFLAILFIKTESPVKPISITMSFEATEEIALNIEEVSLVPEQMIDDAPITEETEVASDEPELLEPDINELVDDTIAQPMTEEPIDLNALSSIDETLSIQENEESKNEDSTTSQPKNSVAESDQDNNLNDVIKGLGLDREPAPPPPSRGKTGKFTGNSSGIGRGAGKGGDEFEKRLAMAGAKTGDIQISIAWDDLNDIDVGVCMTTDFGALATINFQNRAGPNMGMLDIDMNAMPTTHRPVENIFWPPGRAPDAHYIVYVHHYRQWCQINSTTVRIRIRVDDKVTDKQIQISPQNGIVNVFQFDYKRNQ
jgi:hypothetical protein